MRKKEKNNKMKKFDTLTKAEMQVMNALWDMPEGGCIHDIIEKYPEPKPAYTTISTFLKILLNKGFVDYRKLSGKTHTYYPLISREAYTGTGRGGLVTGWGHSVEGSCNAAIRPCTGGSAAPLCQQDFYDASGDGAQEKKCQAVMNCLSIAGNAPTGTWVINFLSAYRTTWLGCTPFATTAGYKRNAQVVNTFVAEHLEQAGKAPTGILFMDYAGVDEAPGGIWHWGEFKTSGSRLVQLIIEQNFR